MLQISADLLALSGEAALLIKYGKVVFSNLAACRLLEQDCTGKSVKSLFGEEVAGIQASSYIGSVQKNGQPLIIRVASSENLKAMFISKPEKSASLINDAFIFSLRSSQMALGLALDAARSRAQELNSPELLKSLASITHENLKVNRIISNVSIISGAENGSLYFGLQHIDLVRLVSELVSSLELMISTPEIRFTAPEQLMVYADPTLVRSMVMNLLSNAITHAQGCTRISVSIAESGSGVMISVDDDGCGISPENLHTIFDRYKHSFRLTNMGSGSGFGLAATRAAAQLHDGTILIESRENSGTAVRVSLSKNPAAAHRIRSDSPHYESTYQELLTGFADCLPDEFFNEKYTD